MNYTSSFYFIIIFEKRNQLICQKKTHTPCLSFRFKRQSHDVSPANALFSTFLNTKIVLFVSGFTAASAAVLTKHQTTAIQKRPLLSKEKF